VSTDDSVAPPVVPGAAEPAGDVAAGAVDVPGAAVPAPVVVPDELPELLLHPAASTPVTARTNAAREILVEFMRNLPPVGPWRAGMLRALCAELTSGGRT